MSRWARVAAGAIALAAWAGLALEFAALQNWTGSMAATLWILVRYFTITTNLIVALVFTGLALAREAHPHLLAGTALAIGLVGAVYGLLLRGLVPLGAGGALANHLLHEATPLAVPLYWLAFARKGRLRRHDAWLWAIYPSVYLVYALARGAAEDRYPYPFLDLDRNSPGQVAATVLAIALAFLAAGYALVWLDRRMAWAARPSGVAEKPGPGATGRA